MIQYPKQADERREAGVLECWCLHGGVGMASDWRGFAKRLAAGKMGSRAVDLWRFLEGGALPLSEFGRALNADAAAERCRSDTRVLLGYSMGGRLALHSLLEKTASWQAAVIISAHPGLEVAAERASRCVADAGWASKALAGNWHEFLDAWNRQSLFAGGSMPDSQASSRLVTRRREIARSFIDWSLGVQDPLWNRLHEIDLPVLWVVGENDMKFRALAERAVAQMARATLAVAPMTGHRVPWEAEAWLASRVLGFLSDGL